MYRCVDFSDILVCWAETPLLSYGCFTSCGLKERDKRSLVPPWCWPHSDHKHFCLTMAQVRVMPCTYPFDPYHFRACWLPALTSVPFAWDFLWVPFLLCLHARARRAQGVNVFCSSQALIDCGWEWVCKYPRCLIPQLWYAYEIHVLLGFSEFLTRFKIQLPTITYLLDFFLFLTPSSSYLLKNHLPHKLFALKSLLRANIWGTSN